VARLRSNCNELEGGMDIICVMTALSKLKMAEPEILRECVRKCVELLDTNKLSIAEACQAMSALASMRQSDRRFVRAIKEFLRTAPLKVMDIGHLCNALVKLEGHVDLLDVFKDALRTAESVGPRDVASILTALALAKVHDSSIVARVCANLIPDAPYLKSYEVSKISVALADLADLGWIKEDALLDALTQTSISTAPSLSPKQLSESINGFSRLEISSRDLWNAFSKQLDIQSPFLYPENAVQILEAGKIPWSRNQLGPVYTLLTTKPLIFWAKNHCEF